MRLFSLLIIVITFFFSVTSADTLNVPGDYPSIQQAIDAAVHGDTVLVYSGTYEEVICFNGKNITVKSANGPEDTIIDAGLFSDTSVVSFTQNESPQAVLEGFTITNGTGSIFEYFPGGWRNCGGGIFCLGASPTIKGNIIQRNHVVNMGAGIFAMDAAGLMIRENRIISNDSDDYAGAIYCESVASVMISENVFEENSAERFGNIQCWYGTLVFSDNLVTKNKSASGCILYASTCNPIEVIGNVFSENTITTPDPYFRGIQCTHSIGNITDNTIVDNTGGGIYSWDSTLVISNNIVSGNSGSCGIDAEAGSVIEDNIVTNNHNDIGYPGGISAGESTRVVNNYISNNSSSGSAGGLRAWNSDVVEGNTIVDNFCSDEGGGMYLFAPPYGSIDHVRNNIIKGNRARFGGGVFCRNKVALENNIIEENSAADYGGGVYIRESSDVDLYQNEIRDNVATQYSGGGVYVYKAKARLTENRIRGNTASRGGGICSRATTEVRIYNNTISQNTGGYGGGICLLEEDSTEVLNNLIKDNNGGWGGGILLEDCSPVTIANNMIARNEAMYGGGVSTTETSTQLVNKSVCENLATWAGGGVYCIQSDIEISNHILWSNQAPDGKQIYLVGGPNSVVLDIDHSTVKGGLPTVYVGTGSTLNWNAGMMADNPQFVDAASGDFHILHTSPCKDAGSNIAVMGDSDFEGDTRITDGMVDMGADEFHRHLYCTGDFTPQGEVEAKILGEPGSTPNYLIISGALLAEPLNIPAGTFYLDPPWILIDLMSIIPTSGLLRIPAEIPALPEAPYDLYLQSLVAGKLTNLFTMKVR